MVLWISKVYPSTTPSICNHSTQGHLISYRIYRPYETWSRAHGRRYLESPDPLTRTEQCPGQNLQYTCDPCCASSAMPKRVEPVVLLSCKLAARDQDSPNGTKDCMYPSSMVALHLTRALWPHETTLAGRASRALRGFRYPDRSHSRSRRVPVLLLEACPPVYVMAREPPVRQHGWPWPW